MNIIEQATMLLRAGKLVAIPTETVYGLGADAKNPEAVQKIYAVKGRPSSNPLIIHIPSAEAMSDFAKNIPADAWTLAKRFWPGPLTLILEKHPEVPSITTGGQDTVALRVPNHPLTLQLLGSFGGGVAAPSANRYGRISPTTTEHVRSEFGSEVDYILEGGPCAIGIESTIVYLSSQAPIILRQGSISPSDLMHALGKELMSPDKTVIEMPGSSVSHYAPKKPLYLLDKLALQAAIQQCHDQHRRFDVLCFSDIQMLSPLINRCIVATCDSIDYAKQLYSRLHALDKTDSEGILVEAPPTTEAWLAINDRLHRAARPTT